MLSPESLFCSLLLLGPLPIILAQTSSSTTPKPSLPKYNANQTSIDSNGCTHMPGLGPMCLPPAPTSLAIPKPAGNGICYDPDETYIFCGHQNVEKALKPRCVLWDKACSGNRTDALGDFFNGLQYAIEGMPCFKVSNGQYGSLRPDDYDACKKDTINNSPSLLTTLSNIKSWMRSPQCMTARQEAKPLYNSQYHRVWDKDLGYASMDWTRDTCCGQCAINSGNVDIYYWPDFNADTSCQSIIGIGTEPSHEGATTIVDPNGYSGKHTTAMFFTCTANSWEAGVEETQTHPINTYASMDLKGNRKVYFTDPWKPRGCIGESTVAPFTNATQTHAATPVGTMKARVQSWHSLRPFDMTARTNSSRASTVVSGDMTFTSPTIYAAFKSVYMRDNCGDTPAISTILSFTPGELSTVHYGTLNDDASNIYDRLTTKSFDFGDLPCPPRSVAEANFWTPEWGNPYRPMIAFPSRLLDLDPLFPKCATADFTAYDPPRTLDPGAAMVAPATTEAPAAHTTTLPVPGATQDPLPVKTDPAAVDPKATPQNTHPGNAVQKNNIESGNAAENQNANPVAQTNVNANAKTAKDSQPQASNSKLDLQANKHDTSESQPASGQHDSAEDAGSEKKPAAKEDPSKNEGQQQSQLPAASQNAANNDPTATEIQQSASDLSAEKGTVFAPQKESSDQMDQLKSALAPGNQPKENPETKSAPAQHENENFPQQQQQEESIPGKGEVTKQQDPGAGQSSVNEAPAENANVNNQQDGSEGSPAQDDTVSKNPDASGSTSGKTNDKPSSNVVSGADVSSPNKSQDFNDKNDNDEKNNNDNQDTSETYTTDLQNAPQPPPEKPITTTVASHAMTLLHSGTISLGSFYIAPGAPQITVSGTPISLGPSHHVYIGDTSYQLPTSPEATDVSKETAFASMPEAITTTLGAGGKGGEENSHVVTIQPNIKNNNNDVVLDSATISPGAAPVTVSGTQLSVDSNAHYIHVGGSTSYPLPPAPTQVPAAALPTATTIAGHAITLLPSPSSEKGNGNGNGNAENGAIVVEGHTITPNGAGVTISNTPIFLKPGNEHASSGEGGILVVGSSTIALPKVTAMANAHPESAGAGIASLINAAFTKGQESGVGNSPNATAPSTGDAGGKGQQSSSPESISGSDYDSTRVESGGSGSGAGSSSTGVTTAAATSPTHISGASRSHRSGFVSGIIFLYLCTILDAIIVYF